MRSIRYVRGTRKWKHGFRGYPKAYRKRKKFFMYNSTFDPSCIKTLVIHRLVLPSKIDCEIKYLKESGKHE